MEPAIYTLFTKIMSSSCPTAKQALIIYIANDNPKKKNIFSKTVYAYNFELKNSIYSFTLSIPLFLRNKPRTKDLIYTHCTLQKTGGMEKKQHNSKTKVQWHTTLWNLTCTIHEHLIAAFAKRLHSKCPVCKIKTQLCHGIMLYLLLMQLNTYDDYYKHW